MRSPPMAEPAKDGHLQELACQVSAPFLRLLLQLLMFPGSSRPQDEETTDKTSLPDDGQRTTDYDGLIGKPKEDRDNQAPEGVDLLAGMPEADKWGIKGLRTLMNNYPDYHAMVVGLDPQTLGLDVTSPE